MRIEELRCGCLPLRPGLILWGYFKLLLNSFLLLYFSAIISILAVFLLAVAAVVILHIIFVIGARKKSVQFLKAYYFYSLTLLVLTCLLGLVYLVINMTSCKLVYSSKIFINILVFCVVIFFAELLIQAYIFKLVRKEIVKHDECGVIRLFEIPVEAQRSLNISNRDRRQDEDISTDNNYRDKDIKNDSAVV